VNSARDQVVRLGAMIYYGGLRALGAAALRRRLQDAGLILCYHNVVPRADKQVGEPELHLPLDQFERQMRWLVAHYDVIPLRAFIERLERGATLRAAAVVTFDDGYAGVFEHAVPILEALRIPATVFVVAEAPGRATGFWWDDPKIVRIQSAPQRQQCLVRLRGDESAIRSGLQAPTLESMPAAYRAADWTTIRSHVGGLIDIGAHSSTHRALPTLQDAELEREVVEGRDVVYKATGVWPEFFAYPYGLWDSRTRAVVREAGYRAALSLEPGVNPSQADRWCLRRVNVPTGISEAAFEAWTAGFQGRRVN
jgi:peptidoglycan/xylan/chitin deacetylase (PgdA/CDA1 family)